MVELVKKAGGGSVKTTAAGVAGLVGSLCGMVLVPLLDGDPLTLPMWGEFLGLAVPVCVGLLAARDHGVTSEQAGLHGAQPPAGTS